jgi:hypothetical protein
VDRIHTWVRNHKSKKRGGGEGGGVVLKVRDNSHSSHGEIVSRNEILRTEKGEVASSEVKKTTWD